MSSPIPDPEQNLAADGKAQESIQASATRKKWWSIAAGVVVVALVAAGLTWYLSKGSASDAAAENQLSPAGYGKLSLSMNKGQALATGDLGAEPTSHLAGCEYFSFADGPKPNAEKIAAQDKVENAAVEKNKIAEEINAKSQQSVPASRASARENADAAKLAGDAAMASANAAMAFADLAEARDSQESTFSVAGGAVFSDQGQLRLIAARPGAKTPEGIGVGDTVDRVNAVYGKTKTSDSTPEVFFVPVSTGSDWAYRLTLTTDKARVSTLALVNTKIRCSATGKW